MMYPIKEAIDNFSALGGIALYAIFGLSFLAMGNLSAFASLFIIVAIIYAVAIVLRLVFFKERPKKRNYSNIIEKIDASSFPSLHAARAGALAYYLGFFIGNNILMAFLIFTAIIISLSRVALKKHDISDITFGLALGLGVAFLFVQYIPI